MNFYRPAIQNDFDQYMVDYEPFIKHIDEETSVLLSKGSYKQAVKSLMDRTGMSVNDAHVSCRFYTTYLKAKSDFNKGVKVYVQY